MNQSSVAAHWRSVLEQDTEYTSSTRVEKAEEIYFLYLEKVKYECYDVITLDVDFYVEEEEVFWSC